MAGLRVDPFARNLFSENVEQAASLFKFSLFHDVEQAGSLFYMIDSSLPLRWFRDEGKRQDNQAQRNQQKEFANHHLSSPFGGHVFRARDAFNCLSRFVV